jgi:hypothetical protein
MAFIDLLPFIVTFADGQRFAVHASSPEMAAVKATDLWRDLNSWYQPVPAIVCNEQRLR